MATIKDVAKLAGVSISTVSLVINDSDLVKMETRYKVESAIEELNYTPNLYARSLVTKKKNVIGVTWLTYKRSTNWFSFNGHTDTYLTEMIPSIEKQVNLNNSSLSLEHYSINDMKNKLPSIMKNEKVDGCLIVGGIVNEEFYDHLGNSNIPVVLVGSRHSKFDYVDTDPRLGIYKATKHLIENGHREIAFINTPSLSQSSDRKLQGYLDAMKESNLPIDSKLIDESEFSGKSAYDIMGKMWNNGIRVTGIVTGYDGIAVGIIKFLQTKNVLCPRDVSVVGFEDSIIAEFSNPALTTVKVHKRTLGQKACLVLFNRIKNAKAKLVNLIIEPDIVIRESTRNISSK